MFMNYCNNGNIDMIKKMSLKYCYLEAGFTKACEKGHYDVVKYLAELHINYPEYAKINFNYDDMMAFRAACINGHYEIVKYMCDFCINFPNSYNVIDFYDMEDPYAKEYDKDYHKYGGSVIYTAFVYGHLNIVKYLVELYKYNKNYKPITQYVSLNSCLEAASEYGHLDIVKYLVELYKNDNTYEQFSDYMIGECLIVASRYEKYHIVKFFIDLYKNNKDYKTIYLNALNRALHMSLMMNYKSIAYLLTLHCKKNKYYHIINYYLKNVDNKYLL